MIAISFPLSNDIVSQMQDIEETPEFQEAFPDNTGTDLYSNYVTSLYLVNNFNVSKCIAACNNPVSTDNLCSSCAGSFRASVSSNITELSDGYDYLMDKWGVEPDQNSAPTMFPYQTTSDLNGNERSNLGDDLYNLIYNSLKVLIPFHFLIRLPSRRYCHLLCPNLIGKNQGLRNDRYY